MTGVGFLIGGVITAASSPPTAFAVSGIGVCLLVVVGAGWHILSNDAQLGGEQKPAVAWTPRAAERGSPDS
jgi:hypothetical protein